MTEGAHGIRIPLETGGAVSGLFLRPEGARLLFVFAHGAGAGMESAFMARMAERLADRGVATLRYQFPYTEAGRKRPDRPPLLMETVAAAVARGRELAGDLPLFAGGKSMGGRMTSMRQAQRPLPGVRGIAFFGFPLHPPGQRHAKRAEHLYAVDLPMLFLQGTRDRLADLDLLRPVCERLGARATLHVVDHADHSFKVLRRSGREEAEVDGELVEAFVGWVESVDPRT